MSEPSQPLLHHCAIFSQDLNSSIKFYEDAFGLKVKARWTELVLSTGSTEQTVKMPGVHLEDGAGRRVEVYMSADSNNARQRQGPINHLAFQVADVACTFQRAVAAGATPDTPPSTVKAGTLRGETAFVLGPDGERIELFRFL